MNDNEAMEVLKKYDRPLYEYCQTNGAMFSFNAVKYAEYLLREIENPQTKFSLYITFYLLEDSCEYSAEYDHTPSGTDFENLVLQAIEKEGWKNGEFFTCDCLITRNGSYSYSERFAVLVIEESPKKFKIEYNSIK